MYSMQPGFTIAALPAHNFAPTVSIRNENVALEAAKHDVLRHAACRDRARYLTLSALKRFAGARQVCVA